MFNPPPSLRRWIAPTESGSTGSRRKSEKVRSSASGTSTARGSALPVRTRRASGAVLPSGRRTVVSRCVACPASARRPWAAR